MTAIGNVARAGKDHEYRSIASALRQRGEESHTPAGPRSMRDAAAEPNRWRSAARLCRHYAGIALEELYQTRSEEGLYGSCLHLIDEVTPFDLALLDPEAAEEAILSELRLVFGVGPVTAEAMRAAGVLHVTDLVGHRRFGGSAAWLMQCWEGQDLGALHDHIRRRLAGLGHGLGLALAGLVCPEKVVVVDLETLGLWGSPMLLFGFARLCGGRLEIHQYLARSGSEEPAALVLALAALEDCEVMVTYNGRSADAPWLAQRCAYFGLGRVPAPLHLDLLHPVRRLYGSPTGVEPEPGAPANICRSLPDCRLTTVETLVLGTDRSVDDLPGDAVPYFYREYERRRNIGPLVPIIDHNRADLVALARLLSLLGSNVGAR
jgi:uncharacterized protein YprB with RNaseH-like and TPR domain